MNGLNMADPSGVRQFQPHQCSQTSSKPLSAHAESAALHMNLRPEPPCLFRGFRVKQSDDSRESARWHPETESSQLMIILI